MKRLMALALLAPMMANAEIIEIVAQGTVTNSYDQSEGYNFVDGTVTAYWRFDTNNVPTDSNSNPEVGSYYNGGEWIESWIEIANDPADDISEDTGTSTNREYDQVNMQDGYNGYDRYQIQSTGYNYYRGWWRSSSITNYWTSTAYFVDYIDDILSGVSLAQSFSWIDDDVQDYGYGSVQGYDSRYCSGYYYTCSYSNRFYINYTLDSLTARAVSEPATLALLGLGLGALVMRRRRNSA